MQFLIKNLFCKIIKIIFHPPDFCIGKNFLRFFTYWILMIRHSNRFLTLVNCWTTLNIDSTRDSCGMTGYVSSSITYSPWKYEAHELRASQQIVPFVRSFQPKNIHLLDLILLVRGLIGTPCPSMVPIDHRNTEFASTF